MLGNGRLREPKAFLHMGHIAAAALPKPAHDTEPHWMRNDLQKLCCFIVLRCIDMHIAYLLFINLSIYYGAWWSAVNPNKEKSASALVPAMPSGVE